MTPGDSGLSAPVPDIGRRVSFAVRLTLATATIGFVHPPITTAQETCHFTSVLGLEGLEISGHLCANAGLHANEGVSGAARIRCGGQADDGYAIIPPALYTEPDSFPGSTYYFVTVDRAAGIATLKLRDRDGIVLGEWPEGSLPHPDFAWKLSSANTLEVECRSGWPLDHATGPFPLADGDSAVVINFAGNASSGARQTDLLIGAGGPPIRATLINTSFDGLTTLDRFQRYFWRGGMTRLKGRVLMEPMAGLGLAVKTLSSSGPVVIGSGKYPMGIYTTGTLDLSSSNWIVVGSVIAMDDVTFGGNGTIFSLAHLGRRVPPFLGGWPNFCHTPFPTDPGPGMAVDAVRPVAPTIVLTAGRPTRIVLPATATEGPGGLPLRRSGGEHSMTALTILILDVAGRRVAEVTGRPVDNPGDATTKSLEFEWDGLASSGNRATPGLYFARSSESSGFVTRRLLLVH